MSPLSCTPEKATAAHKRAPTFIAIIGLHYISGQPLRLMRGTPPRLTGDFGCNPRPIPNRGMPATDRLPRPDCPTPQGPDPQLCYRSARVRRTSLSDSLSESGGPRRGRALSAHASPLSFPSSQHVPPSRASKPAIEARDSLTHIVTTMLLARQFGVFQLTAFTCRLSARGCRRAELSVCVAPMNSSTYDWTGLRPSPRHIIAVVHATEATN